jgi:hypothetical protein
MICIYLHPMTTISTTISTTKSVTAVRQLHSITLRCTCGFRHHFAMSRKSLQIRDIWKARHHAILFGAFLTIPAKSKLFLCMSTIPPLFPPLNICQFSEHGGAE